MTLSNEGEVVQYDAESHPFTVRKGNVEPDEHESATPDVEPGVAVEGHGSEGVGGNADDEEELGGLGAVEGEAQAVGGLHVEVKRVAPVDPTK